jgi:uncharacterized protein YkwD
MMVFGNSDTRAAARLDLAAFRTAALQQHNVDRAKHRVPPLILSPQLNEVAQHHAEQLARTNQLAHSAQAQYGENLYASHASNATPLRPEAVVESWYNERQHYDFNQPGFRPDTGHFTQVVWKASRKRPMAPGMWSGITARLATSPINSRRMCRNPLTKGRDREGVLDNGEQRAHI